MLEKGLGLTGDQNFPDLPTVQAAIQDVAISLNLSEWVLDGVHVWPVARSVVYGVLSQKLAFRYGQVGVAGRVKSSKPRENAVVEKLPSLLRLPNAVLFGEVDQSKFPKILFHQLPQDYEGGTLDRLADPLLDFFSGKIGIAKLCRFHPTVSSGKTRLAPLQYRFTGAGAASRIPPEEIQGFLKTAHRLIAWLKEHWFDPGETPIDLLRRMTTILDRVHGAEDILRRLNPEVLLVHRYHDQYQIPFVIAARRLGIVSVDIQHGYADSCTPSNDFLEAPLAGYVGVPDVFWVWNEGTARRVESGFPHDRQRPKVLVGGAPWTIRDDATLESKRPKPKPTRQTVLIAHQPDMIFSAEEGEFLAPSLLDAIQNSPKQLHWLIRLHPTARHLIAAMNESLKNHKLGDKVEITNASTISWSELAQQVDVVVTGYSALALEARALGIPVILHGPVGAKVFAPILEEAKFFISESSEELLLAINETTSQSHTIWNFSDIDSAKRANDVFEALQDLTAKEE
ncbi:MAG: hypothetical protein JKY20_06160 [Alphaproteobacteria bacterium]|nr:hypothetical protein [Alphaproteobacteria bacterium]